MKNNKPTISFVSPVYKAEHILEKLVIEIEKVMQVIDQPFEVILVDDRSPDNGWNVMKRLAKEYESVKSIRLSRNIIRANYFCFTLFKFLRYIFVVD
jgi:dolichol-phosphate mannosyltransferase